jgi:CubicO group peptidase (beta-lactamase class C family)
MLRHSMMPMMPSERAFGHAGAGGSIGAADPDSKVGFGYAMNQMQIGLSGGSGAYRMLRVFFDAL